MIESTLDGRHRSRITLDEKMKLFLRRLDTLSPDERMIFDRILEDFETVSSYETNVGYETLSEIRGDAKTYYGLAQDHYDGKLVSVEEFISDDYYMGVTLKNLYPRWKEDLLELFHPSAQYTEAIISGSIGSGKTTFSEAALLRTFYELSMLSNPQSTFGLMPTSEIVLVCFNRDDKLARDVTYGGVRSKLECSQYFKDIGCKIGNSEAYIPGKNIRLMAVSVRSSKALGRNVIGGIIDETDFLDGSSITGKDRAIAAGEKSFAEILHSSITRRIKSRYERNGFLPGKLMLSSSARNKESFTNKRIGESLNDPAVFCRDYALYDVKPSEYYSKTRFWVLVGNERIKHKILSDSEKESFTQEELNKFKEEGCRFLHVPDNFRVDFESNIEDSIRDIGGCVTVSKSPYIQLADKIFECVDPTMKSPTYQDYWISGKSAPIIWARCVEQAEVKIPGTLKRERLLRPIRNPEAPRHVHVDLSLGKTDAAGMCIAHVAGMVDVERRTMDGHVVTEQAPIIEVDLFLQIRSQNGEEIDIGSIRGLVYHFMDRGYSFNFASMDNFGSHESLQKYRQQGINAEKISVDTSMAPYDYLKSAIYEGRLSMYNYPIVLNELKDLQRDYVHNRVDHLPNGSKDVADSLAGVVYTLSTMLKHGESSISMGMSEYDRASDDSEWIRYTMERKGNKAPVQVSGKGAEGDYDENSGPIMTIG